jgi:hypothetical protein
MSGTRIGELNGRWAILLKVTLVAIPCITSLFLASFLPWAIWVTGNIYTSCQLVGVVQAMKADMQSLDTTVDNLPPPEWKARTIKLEEAAIENREAHAEIKVILEQTKVVLANITTKLDTRESNP